MFDAIKLTRSESEVWSHYQGTSARTKKFATRVSTKKYDLVAILTGIAWETDKPQRQ